MNTTGLRSDIKEMMCGANFAFVLSDSGAFSPTEYKVMQSQSADNFVKCMKMLYNGNPQLYYITENRYTLEYLLPSLNGSVFLHIITNVLKNVLSVKNNGFLSCCNIDLRADKIYIDSATNKVYLVYVPLNTRLYKEEAEFENELRGFIRRLIRDNRNVASSKSIQFAEDVMNPGLSLGMLYKKLGGAMPVSEPKPAAEAPSTAHSQPSEGLRLVCTGAGNHVILVDKDNFVIGRDAMKADGIIDFDKYVGRAHCRINRIGGQYFVTDLNSTNHTYLDKQLLSSSKAYLLKNGGILRLAKSEFRVEIGR